MLSTRRKRPRAGAVVHVVDINTSFIGIYLDDTCNKHVDEFGIVNAETRKVFYSTVSLWQVRAQFRLFSKQHYVGGPERFLSHRSGFLLLSRIILKYIYIYI